MIICRKCKEEKCITAFRKNRRICKACNKELAKGYNKKQPYNSETSWIKNLRNKRNITVEEYNKIFSNQDGRCAVCHRHQSEFKRRLAIDHCHETGKVRGILCSNCNTALGLLKDKEKNIINLLNYLIKSRSK